MTSSLPARSRFIPIIASAVVVVSLNATTVQSYPTYPLVFESSAPQSARSDYPANTSVAHSGGTITLFETVRDIDPWLQQTMETIEAGRKGEALSRDILNRTEELVSLLSFVPKDQRPTLMFDEDGHPNFATSTPEMYFHLILSSSDTVSWILERAGESFEEDDQPFDGHRLPSTLLAALS